MGDLLCWLLLFFVLINRSISIDVTNMLELFKAKSVEAMFCQMQPTNPITAQNDSLPSSQSLTSSLLTTGLPLLPWITPRVEIASQTPTTSLASNASSIETSSSSMESLFSALSTPAFPLPLLPVVPPSFLDPACCSECSYNITSCTIENNCCLEAFEGLPTTEDSNVRIEVTCDYPQLKPYRKDEQANSQITTNMIRRCPKNVSGFTNDIVNQCENSKSNKSMSIFEIIPVVDNLSLITYENIYCAKCHSVPEKRLVFWSATVKCIEGDLPFRDVDDIINDVIASDNCNLLYSFPTHMGMVSVPICKGLLISTCNETGLWKEYDTFIERACLAYTRVYDFTYKNVFCYMCNTGDIRAPSSCHQRPIVNEEYSFSALINLTLATDNSLKLQTEEEQYIHNEMFDPVKSNCLKVECQFPKMFAGGVCVNMVDELMGVSFDLYFEITPRDGLDVIPITMSDDVASEVPKYVLARLKQIGVNEHHIKIQTLAASIKEKVVYGNDKITTEKRFGKMVFYLQITLFDQIPVSVIDSMFAVEIRESNNSESFDFKVKLSHYYRGNYMIMDARTGESLDTLFHKDTTDNLTTSDGGYLTKDMPTTYHLTQFSRCPYVTINNVVTYTDLTSLGEVVVLPYKVRLNIADVYIQFSNVSSNTTATFYYNASLRVCMDIFETHFQTIPDEYDNYFDINDDVLEILSLVCTLTSMVFALCTFIVYSLLKELRTQPGINNMILSLYTIFAQALYQFGYGRGDDVSEVTCVFIGVALHFTWLAYAMWMNVCCVHMFRVFRSKVIQTKSTNTLRTTICYLAYCWFVASLPIITHAILSFTKSDGENIGYGGELCYITPWEYDLTLLTAPIVCIVTANMILYTVVVVQIRRSSARFGQQRETLNLLKIYLRLSTITGGMWIFALLYMLVDFVWAEYMFVLFSGLKGTLIFFAFVGNRRVFRLMASLCQSVYNSSENSRSSRLKTGHLNENEVELATTRLPESARL